MHYRPFLGRQQHQEKESTAEKWTISGRIIEAFTVAAIQVLYQSRYEPTLLNIMALGSPCRLDSPNKSNGLDGYQLSSEY